MSSRLLHKDTRTQMEQSDDISIRTVAVAGVSLYLPHSTFAHVGVLRFPGNRAPGLRHCSSFGRSWEFQCYYSDQSPERAPTFNSGCESGRVRQSRLS